MSSERVPLVTFRVGDTTYAADVLSVERVIPFTPPRAIPNVPVWLDGVIDHAGRAVPVIDLRARFELPPAAPDVLRRIVIFSNGTDSVAAIVDAVEEVSTVAAADLTEPPAIFRGLAKQYLRALVRRNSDVIVVLDAAQLLSARERIVVDQAMAESPTHGR
ncbi:MAG: purine-binding chemotaxis protein CheW [Gemmatimonadetes bacterium]|nr:purine-binding chemotaxis protein CheW [Gemmatimonadota bacterium]